MILRREETLELSAQVQRLVARLMDQDQNVKETFDGLERRINRHHVAIDCEETQVQSHLPRVFPITNCTGGKGALTQQAHGEFIVSSETIRLPNTQRVHGEYF